MGFILVMWNNKALIKFFRVATGRLVLIFMKTSKRSVHFRRLRLGVILLSHAVNLDDLNTKLTSL